MKHPIPDMALMTKFLLLEQMTEISRLDIMARISEQLVHLPEGGTVWLVIAPPGEPVGIPNPYNGPESRTRAGEAFSAGYRGDAKPEFPPIDELLWQIGAKSARDVCELADGHVAIPDTLSTVKDSTHGGKTKIADRIKVLVRLVEERDATKAQEATNEVRT